MDVRRVVTGHDSQGRGMVVDDQTIEATTVALSPTYYHELWRADRSPMLPTTGENGAKTTFFPTLGGYRFFLLTIPPGHHSGATADADLVAGIAELVEKLPGVLETSDPNDPGMHTTDTVDMEIVLSGEVVLELDGGTETTLSAGDALVQNGTRHRWHNRGSEPAVISVTMVGASRQHGVGDRE